MIQIEADNIIMNDGTIYSANRGIIGLSPRLTLSGGYDDSLLMDWCETSEEETLLKKHRKEIAEYMITQWTRVRDED